MIRYLQLKYSEITVDFAHITWLGICLRARNFHGFTQLFGDAFDAKTAFFNGFRCERSDSIFAAHHLLYFQGCVTVL